MCNRLYTKTFSGQVSINGQHIGPWAKKVIGYVQQEDVLRATDTVSESIQFVADTRLPGQNHSGLVKKIVDALALTKVTNSIIGSAAG